jgi:hypothetical protein
MPAICSCWFCLVLVILVPSANHFKVSAEPGGHLQKHAIGKVLHERPTCTVDLQLERARTSRAR